MRRRWTAAGMLVAEQQFRRIIGYRDLAKLVIAIERHTHLTDQTGAAALGRYLPSRDRPHRELLPRARRPRVRYLGRANHASSRTPALDSPQRMKKRVAASSATCTTALNSARSTHSSQCSSPRVNWPAMRMPRASCWMRRSSRRRQRSASYGTSPAESPQRRSRVRACRRHWKPLPQGCPSRSTLMSPSAASAEPVEAAAYFVAAEALTNVVKHADACHARVRPHTTARELVIEVHDDGVGGARPHGSGLVGLAERVAAFGGRLRVDSPPGRGTLISGVIPIS
jgi:hypothetical protein